MDSSRTLVQQDRITVQPEQPWLLANGKHTPDEHLKTLTTSWSAETWERYLAWYEAPRAESLVPPRKYDQICEEATDSIFVLAQSNADDDLKSRVSAYLAGLTEQQRQVVEMIFWNGRSERFVARELGINQKSVHRLKLRALKKISHLLKGGPHFPYYERGNFSLLYGNGGSEWQRGFGPGFRGSSGSWVKKPITAWRSGIVLSSAVTKNRSPTIGRANEASDANTDDARISREKS